ncbi:MAG: chemotaxis protein CheB, partial [Gammaproteobacteria bacterium]
NAYKSHLLGIILTGANHDGTLGAKCIKQQQGLMIVQAPDTAEAPCMPASVITNGYYDAVTTLDVIASMLQKIGLK